MGAADDGEGTAGPDPTCRTARTAARRVEGPQSTAASAAPGPMLDAAADPATVLPPLPAAASRTVGGGGGAGKCVRRHP